MQLLVLCTTRDSASAVSSAVRRATIALVSLLGFAPYCALRFVLMHQPTKQWPWFYCTAWLYNDGTVEPVCCTYEGPVRLTGPSYPLSVSCRPGTVLKVKRSALFLGVCRRRRQPWRAQPRQACSRSSSTWGSSWGCALWRRIPAEGSLSPCPRARGRTLKAHEPSRKVEQIAHRIPKMDMWEHLGSTTSKWWKTTAILKYFRRPVIRREQIQPSSKIWSAPAGHILLQDQPTMRCTTRASKSGKFRFLQSKLK